VDAQWNPHTRRPQHRAARPSAYVAPGSFFPLRRHPLHGAFADAKELDVRRGQRCRRGSIADGRSAGASIFGFSFTARLGARYRGVRVDATTRFIGYGALPLMQPGDRLRVRTVRCPDSNKPLARSVRLLRRP